MFRNIHLILVFLILSAAMYQPLQAQKKKKKKDKDETVVVEEGKNTNNEQLSFDQAEYLFSEGMKHYILEDYKKALILFEESDRLEPDNPATAYKLADTYFNLEEYEQAKIFAKKARELNPQNEYYYMLLADIYEQEKDYKALTEVMEQLVRIKPSEEYYFNLASTYLYIPDPEKALAAYDACEEKFGTNEMVIRQKQRIYLKQGKIDKALDEGQKLIDNFPGNTRYINAQSQLLLANDKTNEAAVLLEKLLEETPDDEETKLTLARIYKVQGKHEKADEMISSAFESPLVNVEQKIEILRLYQQEAINSNNVEKVKGLAATIVETHPNSATALSIYGDFLLFDQKREEARKHFLQALEIDGNAFDTWQKVINIDWELQDYDAMIKHAENAQEYFPNQPRLYFFAGLGYVMEKDYDMAKDILEMGRMYANTPQLIAQFDAQLGDVFHYLEDYEKSDEHYEKALAIDPENIQVLNNYAYYLSVRKDKLDKALKMGKLLIEKAPDNPTYLDTYGWVLYANGDYKEALKYLEKASQNSNDGTIAEHYGDALYRTGNKQKAMEQWKKALEAGGSENEAVLKKKIASGDLIE